MSAIIGCGTITGQPNAEDYCLTSSIGFRCELQVVSANRELLVTVREAVGMGNRQGESYESFRVDVEQSHRVSEVTIAYPINENGEGLGRAHNPDQEWNREDRSQSHPETPHNFD